MVKKAKNPKVVKKELENKYAEKEKIEILGKKNKSTNLGGKW